MDRDNPGRVATKIHECTAQAALAWLGTQLITGQAVSVL